MISRWHWTWGGVECALFRSTRSGWQCSVGVAAEHHPSESQYAIDLLLWRLVICRRRR